MKGKEMVKKNAWLYLRAKKPEMLEMERTFLLNYAKEAGYDVKAIVTDYTPDWSGFHHMCHDGAVSDTLLISSWNWLGKDLAEKIQTMAYLQNRGVEVRNARDPHMSLDQALSFARSAAPLAQLTADMD